MKRLILGSLAALVCAGPAFAAFSGNDAGTTTAAFLKLGAGARAAAMGEAAVALDTGSTAAYWNPAGLAAVAGPTATVMHAAWFEDMTYDWASYAQPVGDLGVFGIGVQYMSYGTLKGMDNSGVATGSFSPNDLAVTAAWGGELFGVQTGAGVKYISSKIRETATAVALDLGARYPLLDDRLMLAAAVRNIGTGMKFVAEEDPLPLSVRFGGAFAVTERWLATLDIAAPVDNDPFASLGTEYVYPVDEAVTVAGRAGYTTRTGDVGGLNGLTAGFGVAYLGYSLDYAFVPYGDLGDTHRVSLSVDFGN